MYELIIEVKDQFRYLVFWKDFGLGNYNESFVKLQEGSSLKFMVEVADGKGKYLKEKERICALSYNFGLKSTNEHNLSDAIRWLTFSFEYARHIDDMDKHLLVCN